MTAIVLFVRLALAAMFAIASVAKFNSLKKTEQAARELGLPSWSTRPVSLVLPPAELGLAILLVPTSTAFWGCLGSLCLLVAFSVVIVINLLKGRRPKCNCFGQIDSEPIGWSTLIRNGILMAGAALALWNVTGKRPVSAATLWTQFSPFERLVVAVFSYGLAITAIGGWFFFYLLRLNGRLLLRLDVLEANLVDHAKLPTPLTASSGLALGDHAPGFLLPSLDGQRVSLQDLLQTKRYVALIFTDPECGPCSAMLPDVVRWEREHASRIAVVLISRGEQSGSQKNLRNYGIKVVLFQEANEVATAYKVTGTPGALLIDANGLIASQVVLGAQSIERLLSSSVAETVPSMIGNAQPAVTSQGLKIGSRAPLVMLPDLNGKSVSLADLRSTDTLVLFWNPSCGYCSKMLSSLKRWEEGRTAADPQLFVISQGTIEANLGMGVQAPIVIDTSFSSGFAFQIRGTPSAVLIDMEGNIASQTAVGADAIFLLARRQSVI